MIPWIPLSVLSGLGQQRTAPVADDVLPPRNPLGFTNVRARAVPRAADALAVGRASIGFAPTSSATETAESMFRTELSFRRVPLPVPVASAEGGDTPSHPSEAVVGHASSVEDEVEPATEALDDELWPGEPVAEQTETKTRFYKKEIGFFRRKAKSAAAAENAALLDEPADVELDLDAIDVEPEPVVIDDEPVVVERSAEIVMDDEPVAELEAAEPEPEVVVEALPEDPHAEAPDAGELPEADEPHSRATGSSDLWGDADDAETADAETGAEPEAVPASEETQVAEPVVAAVAEPVTKNGRSLRLRPGGPKSKRSGGHGDRGGRKIVGLKIGASQLAAAVVQQVDGRSELVQAARVPLEPGIVVDGDVKDKIALANALKSFFETSGLPRRDVRIGLASNRIGVRTSDVVGIDDPERFDNAVRFKAHEVLPVAVHESVLDYRVIDERASEDGESLRRVLLVVAPRDQVVPYVEVCAEAGLRLVGIDLEALGLMRAFVEPRSFSARTADDTATVVASIGHESSTLLVAGGDACEFTRVFDWGGATLQDAIAQELEVHAAEAGTILRHLALSGTPKQLASLDDDARARAMDAVRSKLTPFARELVSSLQFYQTQPDSLGIGEIVITGGTSHLAGLADSLHQMIGVSVRVGDPLQRVVARTALDPALEATVGSLAVPIGLAIEDGPVRSVNLLPSELRQAGRKRPELVNLAVPVAAAASVAALGFLLLQASGAVSDRQSELDAVQAQIAALPKPARPVIDADVAQTEAARAIALAGVLGGRVSWDGVLRDVSFVLPANVALTRLEAQLPPPAPAGVAVPATTPAPVSVPVAPAQPTGVSIEGYTTDQRSVALLLSRLRTVPSLTNVQLESSTRATVGKKSIVRFIVLADLKPLGGTQ